VASTPSPIIYKPPFIFEKPRHGVFKHIEVLMALPTHLALVFLDEQSDTVH
jgi:hypothetical protein